MGFSCLLESNYGLIGKAEFCIPIIRLPCLPTASILESSRWQRPGGEDLALEPIEDWRSPQFEEQLDRLDRGGVTFEFLRRNRQYRQDYAEALAAIATGGKARTAAITRLSRRWGLSFPG